VDQCLHLRLSSGSHQIREFGTVNFVRRVQPLAAQLPVGEPVVEAVQLSLA
jgi:hypothetical protein